MRSSFKMFTETLTTISKIIPLSLDLRTTFASSSSPEIRSSFRTLRCS